jgi:hypothetical protein
MGLYVAILTRHSPGENEKHSEEPVGTAGAPAKIRTGHLFNTSQKCYRLIRLLAVISKILLAVVTLFIFVLQKTF